MKHAVWILLCILLLPAFTVSAEPVSFCGIMADTEDTVLDFGDIPVTDIPELVEALDRMPNLVKVDMYQSRISRENMDMLFYRYPQIDFGWTIRFYEHTVRTDQTAFSTLHGQSPDPPHTEKEFSLLKYCRHLKALDIGHNWVQDISFLREMPQLEVLIIAINQIQDISPLADLHNLVYLEMFSNKVKDISPLQGLTNLRDANLSNNPITDLTPLMSMTWLDRLWLGKFMRYPEEQEKQIRQALPDTEFFWDWGPTAGTWREHPHYFELYEFFRTNVYVPFRE